jgi:tRNA(Arg) A34 adenosine deaminase TadA
MTNHYPSVNVSLPAWVSDLVKPGTIFPTIEDRMRLAIELADRNISEKTGGPFGAAIFEIESGKLVAPGVNLVVVGACSLAHAEIMAFMIAQQSLRTFDLGAPNLPAMELVTSAQPCIQCWGAVWWSGIKRLITGASCEQTETLTGFDEGPVPPNWADLLRRRLPETSHIEVIENVLSDEACAVLKRYNDMGGRIYNAGTGNLKKGSPTP